MYTIIMSDVVGELRFATHTKQDAELMVKAYYLTILHQHDDFDGMEPDDIALYTKLVQDLEEDISTHLHKMPLEEFVDRLYTDAGFYSGPDGYRNVEIEFAGNRE